MTHDATVSPVVWLFGRGLSMACNLRWGVPSDWARLSREIKIDQLKLELDQISKQSKNLSVYIDYLNLSLGI